MIMLVSKTPFSDCHSDGVCATDVIRNLRRNAGDSGAVVISFIKRETVIIYFLLVFSGICERRL